VNQAVLGGGCFWCLEAAYQQVRGVEEVVSGYAGGTESSPAYEQVARGHSSHAEVVQITFNPQQLSYEQVLNIFWAIHDPTTSNRQGHDEGPQYRSIILYDGPEQKAQAEQALEAVAKLWQAPIVTQLVPLGKFWPAESFHQNYFRTHSQLAYCQVVINPKLAKLRQQFAEFLV
jgi:peptide-methionine (S)-S-oxide reductase